MDIDKLAAEFAALKRRIEPMLAEWEEHRAGQAPAEKPFDDGVDDGNRDAIYAPLTPAAQQAAPSSDAAAMTDAQAQSGDAAATDAQIQPAATDAAEPAAEA